VDTLGWALRLVLVFVLAAAVVGKLRAGAAGLAELAAVVRRWGVREGRARPVAVAVVAAEATAAGLTAWPATAVAGCAAALVLLSAFTAAVTRLVTAGAGVRCRCFGGVGVRLGRQHVIRNATLSAVALAALAVTALDGGAMTVPVPALALVAVMAAAAAALFVFWDDLAALLRRPVEG
jgi:hypothetical protein